MGPPASLRHVYAWCSIFAVHLYPRFNMRAHVSLAQYPSDSQPYSERRYLNLQQCSVCTPAKWCTVWEVNEAVPNAAMAYLCQRPGQGRSGSGWEPGVDRRTVAERIGCCAVRGSRQCS